MASELRIEKIRNLLREELALMLNREMEFPEGSLVTITRAEISQDVHYATVFISVLGDKQRQVLEILSKNIYNIQKWLNRRVKMRPVPKLRFVMDEEEVRREKVEESISRLKKKGEI